MVLRKQEKIILGLTVGLFVVSTITWTEFPLLSPRLGSDSGPTVTDEITQQERRVSTTHSEVELIYPAIVEWT